MTKNNFLRLAILAFLFSGVVQGQAGDVGLVGRWLFDNAHITGQKVKDSVGIYDATIIGTVKLRKGVKPEALMLDGTSNSITISHDIVPTALPKRDITLEAWVSISTPIEWGGIIGYIKDNGGFEKGWLLGYRQSKFSFALSSIGADDGDGLLTYLNAVSAFEPYSWYHVVGTYDGSLQSVYVNGKLENTSKFQSGDINYPPGAFYEMGAYHDDDEFYRCHGMLHEVRVYNRTLNEDEVLANYEAKKSLFPKPLNIAVGPYLQFVEQDVATINWETEQPSACILEYGETVPLSMRVEDGIPKTVHEITIRGIKPETTYYYRIKSVGSQKTERVSRLYNFDSTFNYSLARSPDTPSPYPEDELTSLYALAAKQIVENTNAKKGYCLVLGCGEGRLAYEIAKRTDLKIIAVEEDESKVAAARKALDKAGLYGVRVTVHHSSLSQLPYGNYFANLIVSDRMLISGEVTGTAAEMLRMLRPCGGVAYLGQPANAAKYGKTLNRAELEGWLKQAPIPKWTLNEEDGLWAVIRRGSLPGSGDWSHVYADAGNSTCSGDKLVQSPMNILWFGRPGPRPMLDRGCRKPAPLSTNGRLFIQGDRRIFGLDAYNGTILWTLEIPALRRVNIPRDSGNMAASNDYLHVALGNKCWRLDADTGERSFTYDVPRAKKSQETHYDWGYLACVDDQILGSGVKQGSFYTGAEGEWYDSKNLTSGETYKVTSDYLFALQQGDGKEEWTFSSGVIINSTIAIGDGRIYFVESRNPAALAMKTGRIGSELSAEQYIVALNVHTGEKLWERKKDFSKSSIVLYLSYADGKLIVLDSSDKYHLYAFDAKDGSPLWEQHHNWVRTHHGGHIQHPVIVGGVVYAEPCAFNLKTGEAVKTDMPARGGCGTMSASSSCFFYRDGYHGMWDVKAGRRDKWIGIRPGCWLGIIPAGGIVLAPESSSGCSCAFPIQTSIAFVPRGAFR